MKVFISGIKRIKLGQVNVKNVFRTIHEIRRNKFNMT